MINKSKESIHQEFERFMRDEMDDNERKTYVKSKKYKNMIREISKVLIKRGLERKK
tara:strand:+ start:69 stop:236 length:168 start_codon:yes stop_codon:yes gene_type:complete